MPRAPPLSAEAKTDQSPRGEGAEASPPQTEAATPVAEEARERGAALVRGSINVDALGTEELQGEKVVLQMVFFMPLAII